MKEMFTERDFDTIDYEIEESVKDFYNFDYQMFATVLLGVYEHGGLDPTSVDNAIEIYENWYKWKDSEKRDYIKNSAMWEFLETNPEEVSYWIEWYDDNSDYALDWELIARDENVSLLLCEEMFRWIHDDCITALYNLQYLYKERDRFEEKIIENAA